MRRLPAWTGLFACGLICGMALQAGEITEPDPAAYREQLLKNPHLQAGTGEGFCWHASYGSGLFIDGYEAFKNPKWLEQAELYYDWWLGKLSKDPDGYEGWIGNTINDTADIKGDALVGDSILCAHLAAFAETVHNDPALKERFGKTAQRYQDLATRIVWEKWNKRGCYYEDAAGWGSYRTHDKYIDAKTGQWVARPATVISDNLNKHYSAGLVLLRLWRITGKPEYKERVKKIYGRAKTMWRYFPDEDRIVWNFWMPHGPYDIEGTAPKSWVGVHSSRPGYQAGEVGDFVEVYDSGLVFEQSDFERMIRTNHWMYNDGKKWRCADGTSDAGMLWSALGRFDEKIRTLSEAGLKGKTDAASLVRLAHLAKSAEKPLGWKRQYVKDESQIEVTKVPLQPGRFLSMTQVIPDSLETANADRVKFVTQARAKGELKIELLDAAGQNVLGVLHTLQVDGDGGAYFAPRWDGTNPKSGQKDPGEYRIRWSLAGESRTMPVWVKVGTKREKTGPQALQPGQTVSADFEGELDPRWYVEGATLSEEQAHGGKRSLKFTEGHQARLTFGEDDDLPVKVTFWAYDSGAKLGAKATNGAGWGVQTASGNKFVLRQCWRKYLSGDKEYAWFNTGENQWFSPHPAKLARKAGWSQWVFDFSDPKNVRVTCDGEALGNADPKWIPEGCIALYVVAGDKAAGGVYLDDLKIEYPAK